MSESERGLTKGKWACGQVLAILRLDRPNAHKNREARRMEYFVLQNVSLYRAGRTDSAISNR